MVCMPHSKPTTMRLLMFGLVEDNGIEEILDHLRQLCHEQKDTQISEEARQKIEELESVLDKAVSTALDFAEASGRWS